jgi:hypothetical protein
MNAPIAVGKTANEWMREHGKSGASGRDLVWVLADCRPRRPNIINANPGSVADTRICLSDVDLDQATIGCVGVIETPPLQ